MEFNQKSDDAATNSGCIVRLDRLVITGVGATPSGVNKISGFKLVSDQRPRPKGKFSTYERIRRFYSLRNSAIVVQQYKRTMRWLPEWRFTLIGHDETGILPEEVKAVLANCQTHRVTLFELALDIPLESGIDKYFVLRHAVFGKSRRRPKKFEDTLYYGSRASTKFVRCYPKKKIASFRIELQVHSALLRKLGANKVADLPRLAENLCPSHVRFASISWFALKKYLSRRFGSDGQLICEEARKRSRFSLRRAMRYLRGKGVPNPHRFLLPMPVEDEIREAIGRWARRFENGQDEPP